MKVPIGLPEIVWESPDVISGLWELVWKHIWSVGAKSGRTQLTHIHIHTNLNVAIR
jgi:hypothetical protein